MRLDAADGSRLDALLPAEGRPDREEFLPIRDRGFPVVRNPAARVAALRRSFGSIQRTATSRTGSAARTRAATLTAGESCTSTDVAVPMTRWFVAMSPFASTTNPDAWVVGVQRATTLSCH